MVLKKKHLNKGRAVKEENNQINYKEAQRQACLKWCNNFDIPPKEIKLKIVSYR